MAEAKKESEATDKKPAPKPTKKFLGRDEIFATAAKSLEPKSVLVEEWGGDVRYKPMTMTERRQVRKKCQTWELDRATGEKTTTLDPEKFEVMALIYCCLDPEDDTKLLFNIDHAQQLEEKMAAGPVSTVSTAILVDSGLAPDAIKRGHSGTSAES